MNVPAGVRPEDIPIPDWMRHHLRTFGPDALFCVDGSGTVLGWNAGAIAFMQADPEPEWILRPIARLLGWHHLELQQELFSLAEEHGQSRRVVAIKVGNEPQEAELTTALASEPGEARCFFVYLRGATAPAAAAPPGEVKGTGGRGRQG